MAEYYDREGKPIDMDTWLSLWRDVTYKVIRKTMVGDVLVSTVWLGIDHAFGYSERPLIFETMLFVGAEGDEMYRYYTEAEALADHDRLVEQLRMVKAAVE